MPSYFYILGKDTILSSQPQIIKFTKVLRKIKNRFSHFRKEDFSPMPKIKEAIKIFLTWAITACLFVLFVDLLAKYKSVDYLKTAIKEGLGPHLWNIFFVFGFVLFGAALIFPSCKLLASTANRILVSTYTMGALMFGILLGQFIGKISKATLETWQLWLYGVTAWILFVIIFILIFLTWYLSFLIYSENGKTHLASKIEQMGFWWRISIGLFAILLVLCWMFVQR